MKPKSLNDETFVRRAKGKIWHIMDESKIAEPDSDTHTLCGDHWFYEQTSVMRISQYPFEDNWRYPICDACADAFNARPKEPSFTQLVAEELRKARNSYANINSHHEAYSVILEEVDEYWEEVRKREKSIERLREELVQIAAMCQRAAEDLGLAKEAADA